MKNLFAKKHFAVLGLGRSGRSAAKFLRDHEAHVAAWDDQTETCAAAAAENIPIYDLKNYDWANCAGLILSPGIPHSYPAPHPIVAAAMSANVPLRSDIDLLAEARPDPTYIGITGTNGKSTTTSMIGHLLKTAEKSVSVGGNLGQAALTLAPQSKDGFYVLEMSSFQLELVPHLAFDISVLLNITSDHLDRHGGMAGYIKAKQNIFQTKNTAKKKKPIAVIGFDDNICQDLYHQLNQQNTHRIIPISKRHPLPGGVYVIDGILYDNTDMDSRPIVDLKTIATLPGSHNWQNAAAAYAVAKSLDLPIEKVIKGLQSFPGLAHRQEVVAAHGPIRFINDSKATNADAAAKALASYENIYWILGGRAKEDGIESLAPFFDHVTKAYLIGEAAPAFAKVLDGKIPYEQSGDLVTATKQSFAAAQKQNTAAVILLSPACSSYDQFQNFEERGESFRQIATSLTANTQKDVG